jgi:hypothetical protein
MYTPQVLMMREILAISFLAVVPSYAAQIEVYDGKPELPVIGINGDIEAADADRFQELSSTRNNAVVLLRSAGGKMAPAIRIGEMIKAKGYTTIVKDYCASSCALIWLAGSIAVPGHIEPSLGAVMAGLVPATSITWLRA